MSFHISPGPDRIAKIPWYSSNSWIIIVRGDTTGGVSAACNHRQSVRNRPEVTSSACGLRRELTPTIAPQTSKPSGATGPEAVITLGDTPARVANVMYQSETYPHKQSVKHKDPDITCRQAAADGLCTYVDGSVADLPDNRCG